MCWLPWARQELDTVTPYRWTIEAALRATGGVLTSGSADTAVADIGIDSRTIGPDALFVAIAGEAHDGHDFVVDVLDRGVKAVMIATSQVANMPQQRMTERGVACVTVSDTIQALGDLARFNRNRGRLTVLAVTGSNGKTSTRRLTDGVISQRFTNLSTSGNLNNHIGLPLTLFRLAPGHQTAVLELGMNHAGEITHLGGICQPDVGIITNVGPAHLEGLGTLDNVARAKEELLHTIQPGGTAILNADDPRVRAMAKGVDHRVIYFGCDKRAQVRADRIGQSSAGITFRLITPSGEIPVTLATPARVMVSNALAAAAAGEIMGVSLDKIKLSLEAFSPRSGRLSICKLGRGITLIDDSYNANPESMRAAIDTLARMRGQGRSIAVLGDMLELGEQSAALHRGVGRAVGDAGIDRLYVAGSFADDVADGAMAQDMMTNFIFTGTKAVITDRLVEDLQPGDLILVKGSRGMAMEHVIEAISRWAGDR